MCVYVCMCICMRYVYDVHCTCIIRPIGDRCKLIYIIYIVYYILYSIVYIL